MNDVFDETYEGEIQEENVEGLVRFFEAEPVQPTNWWGVFCCFLLGVVQIVAGSLLMKTGWGYRLGKFLVE